MAAANASGSANVSSTRDFFARPRLARWGPLVTRAAPGEGLRSRRAARWVPSGFQLPSSALPKGGPWLSGPRQVGGQRRVASLTLGPSDRGYPKRNEAWKGGGRERRIW